jgi:acyl transferase domain-containing protein
MFSGQGSQYLGMGSIAYEADLDFKYWLDYCDNILVKLTGESVSTIIKGQSNQALDDLKLSNSALFAIQYALARSLLEKGKSPDVLLGYSLGEYVAFTLAGTLKLKDGLRLVVDMAELAEAHCEKSKMLAVLEGPAFLHRHPECFRGTELAAINTRKNCVVSGSEDAIDECAEKLSNYDVLTQTLPVRYAFHSSLCDPMREAFISRLQSMDISVPTIPVISAHTARQVSVPLASHLWRIIRCRVYFLQTIEGIERNGSSHYWDLGPTGSLANAVGHLLPKCDQPRIKAIMTPFI